MSNCKIRCLSANVASASRDRTRWLSGSLKYAISLGNFSSFSCFNALTNSGTAWDAGSRSTAARRQPAW